MKKTVVLLILALSCALPGAEKAAKAPRDGEDGRQQHQCMTVTKSGNRCKRRARPGERYCKQHSASVASSKPVERCRSITESGERCGQKPVPGRNYCAEHMGGN